jgi:peptidoglycan-associated lipoprotein
MILVTFDYRDYHAEQEKTMLKLGRFSIVITVLALVLTMGLTGCKGKKQATIDPNMGNNQSTFEDTSGEGLPDIDTTKIIFTLDPDLHTVYFDYDSSALRADAMATLRQNADIMKGKPNHFFQVEGHCDERGTQEYNLALGERRALAVREHLINLGVSGDRIVTISYGEEAPAEYGNNEAAWAKNRRAAFGSGLRNP